MAPGTVAQPTQKSKMELEIRPKRYPILKAEEIFFPLRAMINGIKEKYATKPSGEGGKDRLINKADNTVR